MRAWLIVWLSSALGFAGAAAAVEVGDPAPGFSFPALTGMPAEGVSLPDHRGSIDADPTRDAGRRVLAALPHPNAGDPTADSATIYGVETLPTAFVVDGAGVIRHVQRGAAARNINAIESSISALIEPMRRSEERQP